MVFPCGDFERVSDFLKGSEERFILSINDTPEIRELFARFTIDVIGILPDPEHHPDWPTFKAFLEPAAKRGAVPVLEPNETVWAVYEGQPTGAATARLTEAGFGEVVLVGGKDCRRWIHELDEMIGRWMRDEGMASVRAYGRKGWVKVLKGWTVIGSEGDAVGYERKL